MTDRSHDLIGGLTRLAEAVEGLDLRGAGLLGHHEIVTVRERISGAIEDYLVPRIEQADVPLLVVFAGPTGAGKSTLVNSLTGLDLTVAGAIRPTTSQPLVLAGDEDDGQIAAGESEAEIIVGGAPILAHMTFVDTPDIDSTSTQHRVIAESFIDRADIVVFVVSASRYADDVPWEVLRRAVSRGATVLPVLNRLGPGAAGVVTDFASRLNAAGLAAAPVRVPEHHLAAGAQHVPAPAVRELRRRLYKVAKTQRDHQAEVLSRVLNNTTDQARELAGRLMELSAEVDQVAASIARGFSTGAPIEPDAGRAWAVAPARIKVQWLSRLMGEPGRDEWLARVAEGTTAELESRLRADVARHGQVVLAAGPKMTDVTERASAMIEGAVESWFRFAGRIAAARGMDVIDLISGVLAGPADDDEDAPIAQARRDLEGRLSVVWQHFGTLLAEGWRAIAGNPDPGDLRERAAEVAAAHQLADA